jgi:hypothetical protein
MKRDQKLSHISSIAALGDVIGTETVITESRMESPKSIVIMPSLNIVAEEEMEVGAQQEGLNT